jgi:signal transduction histidine kinase
MKNENNVQQSLINIFKVSIREGSLEELAEICHNELIRLMGDEKVRNFYLALYIGDHNYILPYYRDEKDHNHPVNEPYSLKGGLTEYIRKSGKTELIDSMRIEALIAEDRISQVIGAAPLEWIGAPLVYEKNIFGNISLLTYDESIHYSQGDVELIDYVSKIITLAIVRKNRDEEIDNYKKDLEKKVLEKSKVILKKNARLKKEISKVKRNEKIQKVLLNISEAKSKSESLGDLLKKIHEQVKTLMEAKNFYVAIVVDKENGLYRFPYIIDENPEELEDPASIVNLSRGMTHYALKTEQSILADRKKVLAYIKKYNVGMIGKLAQSWMGIPLKTDRGEALGVVSVQSYTDPKAYNRTDKNILSIISTSIADAVKHLQLEEEKKILEEKVLELKKMEAVGILASGIAHEFNNLLSIIMGHSYTGMLDNPKTEKNYRRYEKIEKAGEKAADLVEKLMAFAQKRDTERIYIKDLEKSIYKHVMSIRRSVTEICDISVNIKEKLWPIMIDKREFDDIMSNILENAAHAVLVSKNEGGRIIVSVKNFTGRPPHSPYPIQLNKYIHIKIEDNGHGMEKNTLSQIFNPFFTTKGPGKGIGLGLAIVYSIIKDNNGSIDVESEPGKGTAFHIYLPSSQN